MFNNIVYFILVLLIFHVSYGEDPADIPFHLTLGTFILTWGIFAFYCKIGFRGLLVRMARGEGEAAATARYHGLVARLSILAVALFALDAYFLNLKYWIKLLPGSGHLSVFQGLGAIGVFLLYLITLWYFAHRPYRILFSAELARRSFILSQIRFNLPVLFPWAALSLCYDLLELSPWSALRGLLGTTEGQVAFFACFMTLLMLFLPVLMQVFWGCRPFPATEKTRALRAFLEERGFRYRHLLNWPIFEGRMLTAGIMGILPRFRYILVTESLMNVLSVDELKAVLAHEMGHARYGHLIFYGLFLLGFMVLSLGVSDISFYWLASRPLLSGLLAGKGGGDSGLFYLLLSIPMLLSLILYFRYILGFFMRHFERQADLYSARVMNSPEHTINSLEKIAFFSGKSRDVPSWHHFSIRQRVEALQRLPADPGFIRRHNRFILTCFCLYVAGIAAAGYALHFSPIKGRIAYSDFVDKLEERIREEPGNLALHETLAMVHHQLGQERPAAETYERILELDPEHTVSLNNLAWILVTAKDERLRDPVRALELSGRAVALDRSPVYLDTLAESLYANGLKEDAMKASQEALARAADKDKAFYQRQLERFLKPTSQ
jgi:Zn-dependent protease with chaperone function